jgi:UDP-glucose 4-epimerase
LAAATTELPTTIYHLAGGSSVGGSIAQPQEDFSRTVVGTQRLLDWIRVSAPGCAVVAVSSAAVYGSDHLGPIAETASLLPISPYGQHKRMMEQLCESYAQSFGLRATVVRLFSVYGPLLRKQLLWDLCNRLLAGQRQLLLGGTGAELRDWTCVRDVVRLLAVALGDPAHSFQILNGGSGVGTPVVEIAGKLAGVWGNGASVAFSGVSRAGDPASLIADSTRLDRLGFVWQTSLDAGLDDYIRWFRDQAH